MKKFTLLAVAVLIGGSAFAQTEINGIKVSEGSDPANYHYYRIRNMRAMRLDYTNGVIRDINGDSINVDKGGYYMSEILPDGATPTPKISDHPYMGLSILGTNWWLSFANNPDVQDPNTEYWYFTTNNRFPGQVQIKNAVITGSVSMDAKVVEDVVGNRRRNMDFNTKNNRYYVLPVKPAFAEMDKKDPNVCWTDSILKSISPEDLDMAFAFSLKDTISDEPDYRNQCLDMNNYINVAKRLPMVDENFDTILDSDGNIIYCNYGFAGVERAWSPVTVAGPNSKNHWENNGSIFFVEPVSTMEALAAQAAYKEVVAEAFKKGALEAAKANMALTADTIKGWRNLPALFNESAMRELQTIQSWLESWNGEGLDLNVVCDPDTRDDYLDQARAIATAKLNQAAALVGDGCIVRFQNQLALRDLDKYINESEDVPYDYQLGNAYIAADGDPTYRQSGVTFRISEDESFEDYLGMGIEPRLEADEYSEWELIHVPNSAKFLLYNEYTETYIRKYHDMYDYYGGEDIFGASYNEINEYSWATTKDKNLAAPFTFIGCSDPDAQDPLTDEQLELIMAAGLDTDIENKVRLQACYSETVFNPSTQKNEVQNYTFNIHRGSLGSDYRFVNWIPTHNNWFADSNAFLIESVQSGEKPKLTVNYGSATLDNGSTVFVVDEFDGEVYNWSAEMTVNPNVAATYTVSATASVDGMVQMSGINGKIEVLNPTCSHSAYFGAGESFKLKLAMANIDYKFNDDVTVAVSITNGTDTFNFTVNFMNNGPVEVEETWSSIGTGEWYEGLLTVYSNIEKGQHWPVEIEECDQTPGLYRMKPYAVAGNPMAETFGRVDSLTTIVVNAVDPEKVYTIGDYTLFNQIVFCGLNPENGFSSADRYGALHDGVISFPSRSFAYYDPDSKSWYGYSDMNFKIVLPGAIAPEYTLKATAEHVCTDQPTTTVDLTISDNIAKTYMYILNGKYNTTYSSNAQYVVNNGEEIPAGNTVTFDTPIQSGIYSIMFAGVDKYDQIVAAATTHQIVDRESDLDWQKVPGITTKYTEGFLSGILNDYEPEELDVVLEENVNTPGRFRFEAPYANHSKAENFVMADHSAAHSHYIYVNAVNPDSVYVEPSALGFRMPGFGAPYAFGYSSAHQGTYANNVIEAPAYVSFNVEPNIGNYLSSIKLTMTKNHLTEIEEISSQGENKVVYDVLGRRLAKPTRGLNIVNGKKVFLK